ncbi:MAG: outer membrane beta-barrel protein [Muribaculaceae bacterium]|nr:outer membrane beta-barrel protein [Muribaculaceae bacterium]MBR0024441.1 outer membrane beta-barrel protein [Muribaculaceae bacterium]
MRSYIKYTLITIALLSALSSVAQPVRRWGITVGGNYNEIHFKQSDLFESDRMFGPSIGVTGDMMIPGVGFGIDASILYTMRQGRLHLGDRRVWESLGLGNEVARQHYIDVPLNLKFRYSRLGGLESTLMPFIYAGPTFSFLVGHNKVGDALKYTGVNVLLHAGIGVELFNKVQVSGGYSFSVGQNLGTKLLDDNVAKHRTWFVQATYFFK